MAVCPKCGGRAKKRKAGVYFCRRHGVLPGPMRLDQAGNPPRDQWQGPPHGSYDVGQIWSPKKPAKYA